LGEHGAEDMKTTYFLGAGATKFLNYPDTRDCLQLIENVAHHPPDSIKDFQHDSSSYQLFHKLLDFYTMEKGYVDIEDIYTKLRYFWDDLKDINVTDDNLRFLFFYFFPTYIGFEKERVQLMSDFDQKLVEQPKLRETVSFLMRVIESQIHELYWRYPSVEQLRNFDSLFSLPFIENFNIQPAETTIFTTNYDLAIEDYFNLCCGEDTFEDGFNKEERFQIFHPDRFSTTKKIRLYKLHGSIDRCTFKGDESRIIKLEERKSYFENSYRGRHLGKRYLIYPIKNKVDYKIEQVGLFEMSEFEKHLKQTDLFIAVGFSFRDDRIRETIIKKLPVSSNVFIFSPSAEKYAERLENEGIQAHVEGINTTFPSDRIQKRILSFLQGINI